ncbi:MAG: DUF4129 domain-containing protein, partial [Micromonosporaceae bacterium]|nr:DUF4129 domain-containing protein [Micromonosporaceae bacterium]
HIEHVRRWGRRFTGDGRDVDPWEGSPLAAAGRRLGLIGIVAAVLIPLAAPGMSASFLENLISGAGFGGGAGGGRSVDLMASLQGDLNRPNPKPMLRVRTKDNRPGYLRLGVSGIITERGALPGRLDRGQPLTDGMSPDVGDADNVSVETARVSVLGLRQNRLPAYLHTTDVRVGGRDDWFSDPETSVIWSNTPTEAGLEYEMEYLNATFTAEQLRNATGLRRGHPAVRNYADVPENQVVKNLVDDLTRGETNQYDKVLAIYNHFSRKNGFTYSTRVTTGTSGSAVVDFLDNKQGYCQQYSVAMTWLLRAAGIPARVAIGFTQGAKNSRGYTITTSNAHAWVEVYFAGYGWVPFDPTPASGVNHEADLPWAPNPYEPREDDPQATPSPTSSVSPEPTSSASDRRDAGEDLSAGGSGKKEPPTRWPYWLLGGVAALALLLTPAAQRTLRRRRRLREAGGTGAGAAGRAGAGAAHRAWDELLDTLTDLKIDYMSSDTPRGVARRVTHCRPPLIESTVPQVELIAKSMERAEYSQRPLPPEELAEAVRAVTAELRANSTRPARVTATLFPPSVLRDWQSSISEATQRVYAVWQRGRDAAAQRLLRRLRAGS